MRMYPILFFNGITMETKEKTKKSTMRNQNLIQVRLLSISNGSHSQGIATCDFKMFIANMAANLRSMYIIILGLISCTNYSLIRVNFLFLIYNKVFVPVKISELVIKFFSSHLFVCNDEIVPHLPLGGRLR